MMKDDGVDQQQQQDFNGDIENVENGIMSKARISTTASTPASEGAKHDEREKKKQQLTLHSWSSSELHSHSMLGPCLDLFERNMSTMYEKSSWGLDLPSKREELQHRRARFLVLVLTTTKGKEFVQEEEEKEEVVVVGFCHYRYEYDDDDDPTSVVLYVYEIQICETFRRLGLGKHLMDVIEQLVVVNATIAAGGSSDDGGTTAATTTAFSIQKVMLTVFKRNTGAMEFYLSKLQYQIDETSPSRHGLLSEDYEILSKKI